MICGLNDLLPRIEKTRKTLDNIWSKTFWVNYSKVTICFLNFLWKRSSVKIDEFKGARYLKIPQCFKWFNIFYSVQLKTWCNVKSVTKRKLCIDWCNFGELSKHHLIQQQAVHPDQGHSEDEKKTFLKTHLFVFFIPDVLCRWKFQHDPRRQLHKHCQCQL